MDKLIIKQPETVAIQTPHGLQTYHIAQDTTKEQRAIIAASTGRKIASVPVVELETAVLKNILTGLTLLGHKNHLSEPADQAMLARAIAEVIRLKFDYRTMEELSIIFNMGIRGQLRNKPEDVVFLNVDQVTSWFERYRTKVKPEAMKKLYEESHPLVQKEDTGAIVLSELRNKDPKLAGEIVENFTKVKKQESRKINKLEVKPITESLWIEELRTKIPIATLNELAELYLTLKDQQVLMFGSVAMLSEVETEIKLRIPQLPTKDFGYFYQWVKTKPGITFGSPELMDFIETELEQRNKAA